ncbi:atrial natriuretic peptide receptor 3, partial [Aplysia californica]|uniref:Atrial natriuretic peptide receptor 3 n=1 Tax=Aplysia californica TaxID=6500 RepID=A0ABM0JV01_APLCA
MREKRMKEYSGTPSVSPKMMPFVLLLLCLGQEAAAYYTGPILIASLFPADDRRLFSIKRIRPALEIAVEKVRAPDGPLPGREIEINYRDSNCSSADAMNEAINFYVRNKSHVFLGPCCDYAAAPVGRQTRYWQIPIITTALARDFALAKGDKFSMMTRMGPSINKLAEFLKAILLKFKWNVFKILYQPNGLDNVMDMMCHVMAESVHFSLGYDLGYVIPYFKFEGVQDMLDMMTKEIGTENAIVVLCASPHSVRDIMIKAHELNFDNGEYVFFNIDLFTSKNSSQKPWLNESDTPERNEKARKAYESLMTVTLRKPTNVKYREFSQQVKKRAEVLYKNFNFTYGEDEVNSFVGAFHDA